MQERSIPERLKVLEQKLEGLESVPERISGVELQIVQLRADMNAGFSALRDELREEIRAGDESLRAEIRTCRAEIRNGDEETRRLARILHEEVVDALRLLDESLRKG